MNKGHRVALRWRGRGLGQHGYQRAWMLDGKLVTLRQLEDAAEGYEKLKNRVTERRPVRAIVCGRRPPTAADLEAVEDFGRKLRAVNRPPTPRDRRHTDPQLVTAFTGSCTGEGG